MKIIFEGIDTVVGNLDKINTKAPSNIAKHVSSLANKAQEVWRGATPIRSGHLRSGDDVQVQGMGFTGENSVRYYGWVDEGHSTPRAFHGRPAHHVHEVPGQHFTQPAIDFIQQNLATEVAKFLDE